MNFGRLHSGSQLPSGIQVTSKFVSTYSKLFQGTPPNRIAPGQDTDRFFSDLLDLKVDRTYLEGELDRISKDVCQEKLKPFLTSLFKACLKYARITRYEDIKKQHAVETLYILISRILAKNLTGWEVMDIFAGSAAQSDTVFTEFTEMIAAIVADDQAPVGAVDLRHQVLQLALTFICSVGQLSTGAYFLRRDFFATVVSVVKSPEMEQFTFEAILFLAVLANYYKSDAAKLNPYLNRIRESTDGDFMRKLCWASNFALQTAISTYQGIFNDSISPTNLSLDSIMTRLRPDRVLTLTPSPTPRDRFTDQPIEASVVLLPIYEFLRENPLFSTVFFEDLVSPPIDASQSTPLPCTLITFASYLCSHASSTSSPRSIAYASLSLNILLSLVENSVVMEFMTQTTIPSIRLCRQKLPTLPPPQKMQAPICSILDCCVLWLRHNLHKRLEVNSYTNSVWICYRIIWFLQHRRLRLNYDWTELWNAIIGLLNFMASRMDELHSTGGVGFLASETIRLLDFALCASESFLLSPIALHELIYELVRSSPVLKKQELLLKTLALPRSANIPPSYGNEPPVESNLTHLLAVTDFYAEKIAENGAGLGNPRDAMKIVADEIDANGIHEAKELRVPPPIIRSQDVLDFARVACKDVLALMP